MHEHPDVANLRATMKVELAGLREKLQQQEKELADLRGQVEKLAEAADQNTGAFRDTIQILDAKSCVQEAVLRDLSADLELASGRTPLPENCSYAFKTYRTDDGAVDMNRYFDEWKQKLLQEEASATDPYEGAVMFGGDYAQVDEPSGPDHP